MMSRNQLSAWDPSIWVDERRRAGAAALRILVLKQAVQSPCLLVWLNIAGPWPSLGRRDEKWLFKTAQDTRRHAAAIAATTGAQVFVTSRRRPAGGIGGDNGDLILARVPRRLNHCAVLHNPGRG